MQQVAILSAMVGAASAAKQVVFAVDGGASALLTTGAAFGGADLIHAPAAVFDDSCFAINQGFPFGNFSAYGKFNCSGNGFVDTYGMYSDAACTVKLTQPGFFAEPQIPVGGANPATLGNNFAANPKLNKPFADYASVSGYCPATPYAVAIRVPYTAPGCAAADQAVAAPVGTATTAGFASAFKAYMPYAVGKCYSADAQGALAGQFVRVTAAGIEYFDNRKPTAMVMTAAQCASASPYTPAGTTLSSAGACACSATGVANVTVPATACAAVGASCLLSTGAASTGVVAGVCGFLAGTVDTTGGADSTSCAVVTGGLTAGVFATGVCTCNGDAQCLTDKFCLKTNGQRGAGGKCGVWAAHTGNAIDQTSCSTSASSVTTPLGVCDTKTQSIWTIGSANVFAVSAASIVVAMTSLFA